ncbi:hypothetical protein ACKKBF_B13635 [Auxenochlorella protothecoides x Auxenochlorella symbiontica]
MEKRMAWTAKVLVGYTVDAQTKSGKTYRGILSSISSDKGALVAHLSMTTLVRDAKVQGELPVVRPTPTLALPWLDIVSITAKGAALGAEDVSTASTHNGIEGLGTDADISRGRGGRADRELQRWVPTADEADLGSLEGLEGARGGGRGGGRPSASHGSRGGSGSNSGWDQFALNEAKFGVRTDYAEELYTTALDPRASTISAAEADRIAREIEGGGAHGKAGGLASRHVLEERGLAVLDDSGLDEEDLYGAVLRTDGPGGAAAGRPAASGERNGAGSGGSARPGASAAVPVPKPAASRSAPIDIDARRETNKLRAQMMEGKKTSPYGTPKSLKSPLASPLINDAAKLEALNLNPGTTVVDEEVRRDFQQFKAAQSQQVKRPDLHEFKAFSQTLDNRLRSGAAGSAGSGVTSGSGSVGAPGGGEDAAPRPAPAAEAAPALPAAKPTTSGGLNPFAKAFTFNAGAREFTPSGAAARAPPAPPAAAAAASPAPPAHASSSAASTPTSSSGAGSFGRSGLRPGGPAPATGPEGGFRTGRSGGPRPGPGDGYREGYGRRGGGPRGPPPPHHGYYPMPGGEGYGPGLGPGGPGPDYHGPPRSPAGYMAGPLPPGAYGMGGPMVGPGGMMMEGAPPVGPGGYYIVGGAPRGARGPVAPGMVLMPYPPPPPMGMPPGAGPRAGQGYAGSGPQVARGPPPPAVPATSAPTSPVAG